MSASISKSTQILTQEKRGTDMEKGITGQTEKIKIGDIYKIYSDQLISLIIKPIIKEA